MKQQMTRFLEESRALAVRTADVKSLTDEVLEAYWRSLVANIEPQRGGIMPEHYLQEYENYVRFLRMSHGEVTQMM